MALVKLNSLLVQEKLAAALMRPIDLAHYLKISKQCVNFMLHQGGVKYAPKLARLFHCTEETLLVINKPVITNTKKRLIKHISNKIEFSQAQKRKQLEILASKKRRKKERERRIERINAAIVKMQAQAEKLKSR